MAYADPGDFDVSSGLLQDEAEEHEDVAEKVEPLSESEEDLDDVEYCAVTGYATDDGV